MRKKEVEREGIKISKKKGKRKRLCNKQRWSTAYDDKAFLVAVRKTLLEFLVTEAVQVDYL